MMYFKPWKKITANLDISLHSAKLSFKIEGELKASPGKQKMKEFMFTKPALQRILKGIHIK
jgi:hypothetical protein